MDMEFLIKYRKNIFIVILIIFNLFFLKNCTDSTNELENRISELRKENANISIKRDSILNVNIKLNEELINYSKIIEKKEKEISKLKDKVIESQNLIISFGKDRERLNEERKKIIENRKKVDKLIEDKKSNIIKLSNEDLINSLKIKLNK